MTKLYDENGRHCSSCDEWHPWIDKNGNENFHRKRHGPMGFASQCKKSRNANTRKRREYQRRGVPAPQEGQWEVVFDPLKEFDGMFSNETFYQTLAAGYWNHDMVFYNHKTHKYQKIIQATETFGSESSMKHFISKMRKEAEYEKPPVGQRESYR